MNVRGPVAKATPELAGMLAGRNRRSRREIMARARVSGGTLPIGRAYPSSQCPKCGAGFGATTARIAIRARQAHERDKHTLPALPKIVVPKP